MDQLLGFFDIAGPAPERGASAWARLRAAAPSAGDAGRDAPSGSDGGRSGLVVIDGATGTLTASDTASEAGPLEVSLLGPAPLPADAAGRAARCVGQSRAGSLRERLEEASGSIGGIVGGGFLCAVRDLRDDALVVLRSDDCARQLYYVEEGGLLWFGSHLPTLRRLAADPASVDGSAVSFFLAFGFSPLDRPLFASVKRLPSATMLAAGGDRRGVDRIAIGHLAKTAGDVGSPLEALRSVVDADIAATVAGKTVAVLGASDDPRTAWLSEAALRAGAVRVVPVVAGETATLAQHLDRVGRLVEAEDALFATPALSPLLAAAERAAETADLCLSPEGSTILIAGASRHARFAQRITERWGGGASPDSRSQAFHDDRLFVRDHYFDELAIFDDAARLATAGPTLSPWNVFAMADELGPDLETATGESAADLAGALDARFLTEGLIRPLLGAVSRLGGVPIHAPFLSSSVLACTRSMSADDRDILKGETADWPKEDMAAMAGIESGIGGPDSAVLDLLRAPRFLARGLVGRAALDRMLDGQARGERGNAARLWALCCLETWFRRAVDGSP